MDHHRTCKVVESGAGDRFDPGLYAEVVVPDDALKKGVDEADDHRRGDQLWPEARALGDATGDDCWNGGGKSQQEEELDQLIAIHHGELVGSDEKGGAICHPVSH